MTRLPCRGRDDAWVLVAAVPRIAVALSRRALETRRFRPRPDRARFSWQPVARPFGAGRLSLPHPPRSCPHSVVSFAHGHAHAVPRAVRADVAVTDARRLLATRPSPGATVDDQGPGDGDD